MRSSSSPSPPARMDGRCSAGALPVSRLRAEGGGRAGGSGGELARAALAGRLEKSAWLACAARVGRRENSAASPPHRPPEAPPLPPASAAPPRGEGAPGLPGSDRRSSATSEITATRSRWETATCTTGSPPPPSSSS